MIPAMTHRLGQYWEQPADIRDAPMDDKTVLLTPEQFDGLHEYSASIPTGVYPGKCWKRLERRRTLLVWYGDEVDGACQVLFRLIEVVE
jgi:hypothetical protein